MPNILLSFCIPTYTRPQRINKILQQFILFKSDEIEIIISDDNPNNNKTYQVVKKFKDSRIKYFRNRINFGFDANMLKTIKRANGEFVFIQMDEDDIESSSIPWILTNIKKNKNLTYICGQIGDRRPRFKGDYDEALRVTKKKSRKFEDILLQRYLFNKHYSRSDIRFKFEDKYLKKGAEALEEMLFYYPHGSGIVLRKKILDLNKAKSYIGFNFMQLALIGQALISGDTLSTLKIFAYFGETQFKSDVGLYKGKKWWHPLSILNLTGYKINLIHELIKTINKSKKLKKKLLKNQYDEIYNMLLMLLSSKNTRNFAFLSADFEIKEILNNLIPLIKSFIPFLEGISIVLGMKKQFRILMFLMTKAISGLLKSFKK